MSIPSSAGIELGRKVIHQIRKKNGAIEPGAAEYLRENYPDSLEAIENNRRTVGRLTQLLSKNLYAKSTRFMFELIQNADDNQYGDVEARGILPWVSLTLAQDEFILECNEDGFLEKNVWAVCKVAESTKTADKRAQGYIGEKGIGFKSIFRVYKKAHIQSGNYAFSFLYEPEKGEDAGLDLVTPILENHMPLNTGVRTRIALSLPYQADFQQLYDDLRKIPDTILLFLNRIRQLEIHVKRPSGRVSSVRYTRGQADSNSTSITQDTTEDSMTRTIVKKYILERRETGRLPEHETRKGIDTASIVLAFPVDKNDSPSISQQHVFAFLPLQQAGFNFLIQSDFITSASRELIDDGCARNKKLLQEVADTFVTAIKKFSSPKGPKSLQYSWMEFLPTEDTERDQFWRHLRPAIIERLRNECIARTWHDRLGLPNNLTDLPVSMRDSTGEPLLPDTQPEGYLSPKYSSKAIQQLRVLGVSTFRAHNFLDRLAEHAIRPDWKLRTLAASHNWVACLSRCLVDLPAKSTSFETIIRDIPLIRLEGDIWVKANDNVCYWPTIGDTSIPPELDICIVQPKTEKDFIYMTERDSGYSGDNIFPNIIMSPQHTHLSSSSFEELRLLDYSQGLKRGASTHFNDQDKEYRRLLTILGVRECPAEHVKSHIVAKYQKGKFPALQSSWAKHQLFLFEFASKNEATGIPIIGEDSRINFAQPHRRFEHVYLAKSQEPLGPEALLAGPGEVLYEVDYLHPCYLAEASYDTINLLGQSWAVWLADRCGVRSMVQVLTPNSNELSPEFEVLLEQRQQVAFKLLRETWTHYRDQVHRLRDLFIERQVLNEANEAAQISDLYAPLPSLKRGAAIVGAPSSLFLQLPPLTDGDEEDWRFLSTFGLRFELDANFYLRVIHLLMSRSALSVTFEHVLEVYICLSTFAARDSEFKQSIHPSKSNGIRSIYWLSNPSSFSIPMWVAPSTCRWNGEEFLTLSCRRINEVPQYSEDASLELFFKYTLGIKDATYDDYIEELSCLKRGDFDEPAKVVQIYEKLASSGLGTDLLSKIRSQSLVYIPKTKDWLSPEACTWIENNVRVDGMVGIADLYPQASLKSFFCDALGITVPSIKMYIKTLEAAAKSRKPVEELKQQMRRISTLNPNKTDVKSLLTSDILPLRMLDGSYRIGNAQDNFAIIDREEYSSMFANQISTLQLDLIEIQRCRNLLLALGLQDRFCSQTATERTSAENAQHDSQLTVLLRGKAEALLRCAVLYNDSLSPSEARLLAVTLQSIEGFASPQIKRLVELEQDGQIFQSIERPAAFHFLEDTSGLKLYVPHDGPERERCFHNELPLGILKQLGISNPSAKGVVISILTARWPETVAESLRQSGIPELTHDLKELLVEPEVPIEIPVRSIEDDGRVSPDLADLFRDVRLSTPRTESLSRQRSVTPATSISVTETTTSWARSSAPISRGSAPSRVSLSPAPNRRQQYAEILDRIIKIATEGPVDILPFSFLVFSQLFPERSLERDMHVGVAGEVYLLEYLQSRDIPGFGIGNWHSNIRTRAEAHARYQGIGTTSEPEEADFVYRDTVGALTRLLQRQGALSDDVTLADDVEYYLEVKTTTSGCGQDFYMSDSQVKRMESMAMRTGVAARKVYVIARVFNIDQAQIGLKFFVDPQRCRSRSPPLQLDGWAGQNLEFSAAWTVRVRM